MYPCNSFFNILENNDISFYTGVPDSLLKNFCAYATDNAQNHIIAANEGGAVGLAAGHYLATGNPALVYMQNSGQGNAINPLASLADPKVYSIPMLLLIGWRGEPGIKDEPQHVKQGEITLSLLDTLGISYKVLGQDIVENEIDEIIYYIKKGKCPGALIVRKGFFKDYKLKDKSNFNNSTFLRERALELIVNNLPEECMFISTTGKTSRELFEIREHNKQGHHSDFLVVGSMGHSSQIALGIALEKKQKLIVCIDGDGAALMHLGNMAIVGQYAPNNYIHIVLNNGSHESVGGQPTIGNDISFTEIAHACGYKHILSVKNEIELIELFKTADLINGPAFIEVIIKTGSRNELGRPSLTPVEIKDLFMEKLD